MHVGDWLSLLLAERAGVDPVDIKNIDHLKNAWRKFLNVQPQVHFTTSVTRPTSRCGGNRKHC